VVNVRFSGRFSSWEYAENIFQENQRFPGENPDSLSPGPFSDPENLQFSQNIPKIFPAGKFTGISHII
jgi:hypothetical protein